MKKNKTKQNVFFHLLDVLSDAVSIIIQKINKFLTDKKKSSIFKIIIRFVCAFILIFLLEIPFFLVKKTGEGVLYLCDFTLHNLANGMWGSFVDYAYILFALIFSFKIVVDMAKKKEYNFIVKKSKQEVNNLYYSLQDVLKVIIAIFLVPLGILVIVLFAGLGMQIALLTHGIYVFGPMLMIVGLLLIVTFLLSYLYDIVFPDKGGKE